jgi:uncharacterized protein (TIGR03083 family)
MTSMENATVDVTDLAPLTHDEGMDLSAVELDRHVSLMRQLSPEQWGAQTDCPDWDVRRMYLHMLGACESGASWSEFMRQMMAARRYQRSNGGPLEAALSATQVTERIDMTPEQVTTRFVEVSPKAVKKRRGVPSFMRAAKLKIDGPIVEKWTFGYMIDTIYLRDAWMHRIDVCRAAGVEPELTADHDGRIVADIVAEWGRRHGQPFTLTLTGPAGGRFVARGGSDSAIELDAVEFCRILSGRGTGTGLLTQIVPF